MEVNKALLCRRIKKQTSNALRRERAEKPATKYEGIEYEDILNAQNIVISIYINCSII